MNEETEKYVRRTTERLEEILQDSPWKIRDSLKAFTQQLKNLLPEDKKEV